MTWQRRLAEMLLAGGTITVAVACSTSGGSNPVSTSCCDQTGPTSCCNANGDPCCQYNNCGGTPSPECAACMANPGKCACQMSGGTWTAAQTCQPWGSAMPDAAPDAREAGGSDAQASD